MASITIEALTPGAPNLLSGSGTIAVEDPADPGTPTTIIETDDAWDVKVDWSIKGLIAGALGGDWKVEAFLASVDGGTSPGSIGVANVPLNSAPPTSARNYTATINVPAGKVSAGLYRLTVAITYSNLGVPQEMAAFSDGPVMQFYVPA